MTEQVDERVEMQGLPAAIQNALRAHPKPIGFGAHVKCSGPDCDWSKPAGSNIKRAWLRHQTWTLHMAVQRWYFDA